MSAGLSPACQNNLVLLLQGGTLAGLSDSQLLDQFLARRDPASEAALATLCEPAWTNGPAQSAWTCWVTRPMPTTPFRPRSWC